MKTFCHIASVTVVAMLLTFTAHAAEPSAVTTPQSVTRIAKIAGSVIQTTVRSVASVAPIVPSNLADITAVCITSGSSEGECGVAADVADLAKADCRGHGGQPGASDRSTAGCPHSTDPQLARQQHVALCNADDVGLAGCLSKYAASLVKHPGVAEKVYQFSVRRDSKDLPDVTVLATAKQTEADAAAMAVNSMASATTASRN